MKESYIIAIDRPGMADIPELCRTDHPEIASELVLAILRARDDRIRSVRVDISRVASKEVAV